MNKIIVIITALIGSVWGLSALAAGDSIILKKPPEVLAKWYKPDNKRQVWLHTMFRLRREILAINDYADKGQQIELEKWTKKFVKDYQNIAKMVPQWQEYLYLEKLEELETLVKRREYSSIKLVLKKMGKSCMKCHDDYQTVTTLLYRTPDFNEQTIKVSGLDLNQSQLLEYDEFMAQLSNSVNRINIAIKDEFFSDALKAILPLEQQLAHLSNSCGNCHGQDEVAVNRIMAASKVLLPELAEKLQLNDKKQSGKKLGEFAVNVCARCHAIHRLTSDLKGHIE